MGAKVIMCLGQIQSRQMEHHEGKRAELMICLFPEEPFVMNFVKGFFVNPSELNCFI